LSNKLGLLPESVGVGLVEIAPAFKMAGEVVVDALPYFDQGYDEPGVRDAVRNSFYVASAKPLFWCELDS
jgi:hypothetical protein